MGSYYIICIVFIILSFNKCPIEKHLFDFIDLYFICLQNLYLVIYGKIIKLFKLQLI